MQVTLITTGRMELLALPDALKVLFPDHAFLSLPYRNDTLKEPFPCFTAQKVIAHQPDDPPGKAGILIQGAIEAVSNGADMAIILEDLEVVNIGNEPQVIEHLKEATRRYLKTIPPNQQSSVENLLKQKVSFHLAVPMPESWFFGDPDGLSNAGVPSEQCHPRLVAERDPEFFCTDDPDYSADDGTGCTTWVTKGKPGDQQPFWIKISRRCEHPKAYLCWLARPPNPGNCSNYSETKQGARALRRLNWKQVLQNQTWYTWLRSLIHDLEQVLGAASIPTVGACAPLIDPHSSHVPSILRNL